MLFKGDTNTDYQWAIQEFYKTTGAFIRNIVANTSSTAPWSPRGFILKRHNTGSPQSLLVANVILGPDVGLLEYDFKDGSYKGVYNRPTSYVSTLAELCGTRTTARSTLPASTLRIQQTGRT
jgi:hypothetical protein